MLHDRPSAGIKVMLYAPAIDVHGATYSYITHQAIMLCPDATHVLSMTYRSQTDLLCLALEQSGDITTGLLHPSIK